MGALDLSGLPQYPLLLLDSAPIIYFLEEHPKHASRFAPLFEMHARGLARFAVTTVTIAEVLTGPGSAGNDVVVRRYRNMFKSWQIIVLDAAIAEVAARLRGAFRLKLPDAVQVASALSVNADALVTHDRDFSKVTGLRVIS
jgi:predicted nucleic acid-binding protein